LITAVRIATLKLALTYSVGGATQPMTPQ